MRIEGSHPTGQRVVIIKTDVKLFELYCYTPEGALILEKEFNNIELAKIHARNKYMLNGRWRWIIKIRI